MPVPSWLSGATLNQWLSITANASTNRLSDVTPSAATYPGNDDAASLMEAWNDGALRVEGSVIELLVHGGGHDDGADNAIYTYGNLNSNNPTWARVSGSFSDPADIPAGGNVSHNDDGRPAAMHGYKLLVYDPGEDVMVRMGAADVYGGSANSYRKLDSFDFDTGAWTAKSDSPNIRTPAQGGAVWSSVDDIIYYHYGGGGFPYDPLRSYDHGTDTHTQVASGSTSSELSLASKMAYDTSRDHILALDAVGDEFRLWDDIGNTSAAPATITLTGDTDILTLVGVGLIYDPDRDLYIAYRGVTAAEKTIYEIDPSPYPTLTWTCTKVTPSSGSTPSNPGGAGEQINGRFLYVSTDDFSGYLLARAYDDDVYFYPTFISVPEPFSAYFSPPYNIVRSRAR